MDLGLLGKKVVITGATQGIGLATAEEFVKEGASVCITGRDRNKLVDIQKRLSYRVDIFEGDLTKVEDIMKLQEWINKTWGKIDVLVPNIGSGKPMNNNPLSIEEWVRLFNINLFSCVQLVDKMKDLIDKSEGSIIMISSIVAKQVIGSSYAYAASKNGILSLVKYMAKDFAQKNIRVNCVLPGNVLFEGGRWEEIIQEKSTEEVDKIKEGVAMKRFGEPEEIASGIVFLASSKASFITGTCLVIDGGQTCIVG